MLLATELCCGGFELDGKVCWLPLSNDFANPPLGGNNIFLRFYGAFHPSVYEGISTKCC